MIHCIPEQHLLAHDLLHHVVDRRRLLAVSRARLLHHEAPVQQIHRPASEELDDLKSILRARVYFWLPQQEHSLAPQGIPMRRTPPHVDPAIRREHRLDPLLEIPVWDPDL